MEVTSKEIEYKTITYTELLKIIAGMDEYRIDLDHCTITEVPFGGAWFKLHQIAAITNTKFRPLWTLKRE